MDCNISYKMKLQMIERLSTHQAGAENRLKAVKQIAIDSGITLGEEEENMEKNQDDQHHYSQSTEAE